MARPEPMAVIIRVTWARQLTAETASALIFAARRASNTLKICCNA